MKMFLKAYDKLSKKEKKITDRYILNIRKRNKRHGKFSLNSQYDRIYKRKLKYKYRLYGKVVSIMYFRKLLPF